MTKKIIISFLSAVVSIWASQFFIFWILGFFPDNPYVTDVVVFLYSPIATLVMSICLYLRKEKSIAIGFFAGGLIYCLAWTFVALWGIGDVGCTRYFFNLLTNCPGIK